MTVKWTQRVEERPAHFNSNPGTRKYEHFLTDSDEEAIVEFVKDHEDFYNKTNEHFKDKAMKECLCEKFEIRKGLSKSPAFKYLAQGVSVTAASAHDISRGYTAMDMEMSI